MGNRIWNSELIPEVTPHWPLFLCAPLQRWPHCKPQTAHCSWAVISKLDFRFQTGSPTICPMSKQMGTTISRILMVNVTKPHTSSLGVSTNLNHPSNYHHIYIYIINIYIYIYIYIWFCCITRMFLLCTHFGTRVSWFIPKPSLGQYRCHQRLQCLHGRRHMVMSNTWRP